MYVDLFVYIDFIEACVDLGAGYSRAFSSPKLSWLLPGHGPFIHTILRPHYTIC